MKKHYESQCMVERTSRTGASNPLQRGPHAARGLFIFLFQWTFCGTKYCSNFLEVAYGLQGAAQPIFGVDFPDLGFLKDRRKHIQQTR